MRMFIVTLLCALSYAQTDRCSWSDPIRGSIAGHNIDGCRSGFTLSECKQLCDDEPDCQSLDVDLRSGGCCLGDCQIGDGVCVNDNDGNFQYYQCDENIIAAEDGTASEESEEVVADVTSCSSHADCTNVQNAEGMTIGVTYCYDFGVFTTGSPSGEFRCAGNVQACCECSDNDAFDQNADNCPSESDCENFCNSSCSEEDYETIPDGCEVPESCDGFNALVAPGGCCENCAQCVKDEVAEQLGCEETEEVEIDPRTLPRCACRSFEKVRDSNGNRVPPRSGEPMCEVMLKAPRRRKHCNLLSNILYASKGGSCPDGARMCKFMRDLAYPRGRRN